MQVLTTVLPLIGTWVGTVMAYYFSRENFEAASHSAAELVKQLTPQEKLRSTPARDKMIPRQNMFAKILPADEGKLLNDILNELDKSKKGNRVPILSDKGCALYVVHRSIVDRYIATQARSGVSVLTLTLKNLLEDAGIKDFLKYSFALVAENVSLADAKQAMESRQNCQDIFVTANAREDEDVKGWVTNIIIQENSKV